MTELYSVVNNCNLYSVVNNCNLYARVESTSGAPGNVMSVLEKLKLKGHFPFFANMQK